MSRPRLNTLNFRPNTFEKGRFSVVFFHMGRFVERRFETREAADKFAEPWIKEYSKPEWGHRTISEWVDVTEDPMYINARTGDAL